MATKTFDPERAYDLINQALRMLGEHGMLRDCDTPELAQAAGYLSMARSALIPLALVKRTGYAECPGSFMGNHTVVSPNIGRCQYCGHELRTIHHGHNLREHYVPAAAVPHSV